MDEAPAAGKPTLIPQRYIGDVPLDKLQGWSKAQYIYVLINQNKRIDIWNALPAVSTHVMWLQSTSFLDNWKSY